MLITKSKTTARIDLAFTMAAATVLAAVVAWSCLASHDVGEKLTRNTIRLSLGWYTIALLVMMQLQPDEWSAATRRGRIARWCWTWGLLCFLIHLAMAFHFYHHWSHANAFEHTRQVGGIGEGIYMSYLFTWVWVAYAGWWWFRPDGFAAKPLWVDRTLHAFMLFIVLNGTVVFEQGAIRWAGLVMFGLLSTVWLTSRGLSNNPWSR
jgi:hypothetical protein